MTETQLKDFKNGTYDALLYGIRSETNKSHYYKQGYDFGLVLYNDQIDEESELGSSMSDSEYDHIRKIRKNAKTL
tara:strand:- start:150 stop:374 length:225 start_codon:yes stop_codon:yes gene_type:complete